MNEFILYMTSFTFYTAVFFSCVLIFSKYRKLEHTSTLVGYSVLIYFLITMFFVLIPLTRIIK